jgi:hypothetical protein
MMDADAPDFSVAIDTSKAAERQARARATSTALIRAGDNAPALYVLGAPEHYYG